MRFSRPNSWALVLLSSALCGGALAAEADSGPVPQPENSAVETVVVTGSRIPKAKLDAGPAPVIAITAEDIQARGFADTAAIMTSLTQNLGALDNNQNTDGFSPGAQAVDLRGMGPNHTLVLVNGRRIADYPQAYQGNSNFTDISNIPTTMIERIEILSGSDSAVYGSDAIAGVINFILKKHADGTTLDFRDGETQHGGGSSQRLSLTSGFSTDRFESIFSVQLTNQQPLWAFQRSFTNSRLDSGAGSSDISASPVFVRSDSDGNYIDPGQATCAGLSHLDQGTIIYSSRPGYAPGNTGGPGYYCGSYYDVGYGTLENGRKAVDVYGSATYHLTDKVSLFMDLQAGFAHQVSYNTPLQWQNSYPLDGDSTPTPFFDSATGQVEQWQRKYFTIEENGGLEPGEIHNINHTLAINTGVRGSFGADWNYEAFYGHSSNTLEAKTPALVAAKAQALYLGPSLGIDPGSGYNIYNAPPSRLYTPLTVAQFRSITQDSIDNDKSHTDNVNLSINTVELARLPAGPLGFAAVAEYGHEYLAMDVDPLSLDGSYYGLHNTGAVGSRDRYGLGVEFNAPLTSMLTATAATRLDSYKYSSTTSGKVTYNAGLEFRPIRSLLLRASYGTGFRAPDLSYLYAGPSGSSSDDTDYWWCRLNQPETGPDFSSCDRSDVDYNGRSHGSTALKDETSTSFTYGVVFSPLPTLQVSVDYYRITLKNEVQYQQSDQILRQEADCRLGQTPSGQPVDINSAGCQAAISQVARTGVSTTPNLSQVITSVLVLPINAAEDRTSGIDVKAHYQLGAGRAGIFDFDFGLTDVLTHTIQYYPGDPVDDELTDLYNWVIPRYKANASIGWTLGPLTTTLYGSRLGGLPNYAGTERLGPTSLFNASATYRFTPDAVLTLTCNNLFDTRPQKDDTWTSYPYYSSNWFSPVGRSFFAEFSYHFDWPRQ
ncbi:MAG: TonB-dependent receptor [Proteobacteria bacterium]|nr:TonB-dependent receptor [Pseudomonadota bacterium]